MVIRNPFFTVRTKEINLDALTVSKRKSSVAKPTWLFVGLNCRDAIKASRRK